MTEKRLKSQTPEKPSKRAKRASTASPKAVPTTRASTTPAKTKKAAQKTRGVLYHIRLAITVTSITVVCALFTTVAILIYFQTNTQRARQQMFKKNPCSQRSKQRERTTNTSTGRTRCNMSFRLLWHSRAQPCLRLIQRVHKQVKRLVLS